MAHTVNDEPDQAAADRIHSFMYEPVSVALCVIVYTSPISSSVSLISSWLVVLCFVCLVMFMSFQGLRKLGFCYSVS